MTKFIYKNIYKLLCCFASIVGLGLLSGLVSAETSITHDTENGRITLLSRSQRPASTPSNADSSQPDISADGMFVAFSSKATNLVEGDYSANNDIFVHDRTTNLTERITQAFDGAEANGHSYAPKISADGRYVVFMSYATNLLEEAEPQSHLDPAVRIYHFDRQTDVLQQVTEIAYEGAYTTITLSGDGLTVVFDAIYRAVLPHIGSSEFGVFVWSMMDQVVEPLALNVTGSPADGRATGAVVTHDGSKVYFASTADDLVEDEGSNNHTDIYKWENGDIERLQIGPIEINSGATFTAPRISADGRYILFRSNAANLVDDVTYESVQLFHLDTISGEIALVSINSDGEVADAHTKQHTLSGDGQTVTFISDATNLAVPEIYYQHDVFVHHVATKQTQRVEHAYLGEPYQDSYFPRLSHDGKSLVFASRADNLAVDDGSFFDVHLFEVGTQAISTVSNGYQLSMSGLGASDRPVISADGHVIAYVTDAKNLIDGTGPLNTIMLQNGPDTAPEIAPIPTADGMPLSGRVGYASPIDLSATGRWLAFASGADNIEVTGPNAGESHVINLYLLDRRTQEVKLITRSANPDTIPSSDVFSDAAMTPDGRYLIILSATGKLTTDLLEGKAGLYRFDTVTDTMELLTRIEREQSSASRFNRQLDVSDDGNFVIFSSTDSTLIAEDTTGTRDVFLLDVGEETIERISGPAAAEFEGVGSQLGAISGNGRYIVYSSDIGDIAANDLNEATDVFLYDRVARTTELISQNFARSSANADSSHPSVSSDGRYVYFRSFADNIVAGVILGNSNLYRHDRETDETILVSSGYRPSENAWRGYPAAVSADGLVATFDFLDDSLVRGDNNRGVDVFLFQSADVLAITLQNVNTEVGVFGAEQLVVMIGLLGLIGLVTAWKLGGFAKLN